MKYEPLERSGLVVPELCLDTMVFGDDDCGADELTDIRMIRACRTR